MYNTFKPSKPRVAATILAGREVADGLVRFRAQVGGSRDVQALAEAIQASAFNGIRVLTEALFKVGNGQGNSQIWEGFGVIQPLKHRLKHEEAAAALENLGCRHVASNMYLDDEDKLWQVDTNADGVTISRANSDDVFELLASASRVNLQQSSAIKNLIGNDQRGAVVYVDKTGEIKPALVFASVEGSEEAIQILHVAGEQKDQADVINLGQIVRYRELPPSNKVKLTASVEDLDKQQVLDYYRKLYSNDPVIMQILEEMLADWQ